MLNYNTHVHEGLTIRDKHFYLNILRSEIDPGAKTGQSTSMKTRNCIVLHCIVYIVLVTVSKRTKTIIKYLLKRRERHYIIYIYKYIHYINDTYINKAVNLHIT